jgi:hypothetical protein
MPMPCQVYLCRDVVIVIVQLLLLLRMQLCIDPFPQADRHMFGWKYSSIKEWDHQNKHPVAFRSGSVMAPSKNTAHARD